MNQTILKLGYYSALISILLFITWIISFTVLLKVNPVFRWTNIQAYVEYILHSHQDFKFLAQAAMMFFGPVYLMMIYSLKESVTDERKIFAEISLGFGIIFTACAGIHYFIQLSTVPLSIQKGELEGLTQFIQANPISGIAGLNMAGWTLFLGLSTLFLSFSFKGQGRNNMLHFALMINGINCLTGGVAFILGKEVLVFLSMNLIMGLCLLISTIGLLTYFKNQLSLI